MDPEYKAIGAMVGERRKTLRLHLLTRVDILGADGGETYWGSLNNVSRTGLAVALSQPLKSGQKVTVRFRFRSEDGKEPTEMLAAKVIWRSGDNTGLEFETPLTTASPALKKAPYLAAHLMLKEAGR